MYGDSEKEDSYPIRSFGAVVYEGITECLYKFTKEPRVQNDFSLIPNVICYPDVIQVYGEPSLQMRNGTDWPTSLGSRTINKEHLNLIPMSIESIYPCPANDFINCVLSVPYANNVNINIYDISGRTVSKSSINFDKPGIIEAEIDTSGLKDGVYILNASSGLENATKRFVIVR